MAKCLTPKCASYWCNKNEYNMWLSITSLLISAWLLQGEDVWNKLKKIYMLLKKQKKMVNNSLIIACIDISFMSKRAFIFAKCYNEIFEKLREMKL